MTAMPPATDGRTENSMTSSLTRRLLTLLLCLWPLGAASAQSVEQRYEASQKLFDRMVYLEQRFDTDLKNLYADSARIVVLELRGDKRYKTEMTGADYKELIDSYLPTAAIGGQWFTYSNVSIAPEGDTRMRILASRKSHKTGEAFPYQVLVGPSPGGSWLIYEETSMVRP